MTAPKRLQVLLVEDSEDDALLFERELEKAGKVARIKRVYSAAGLRAALDEQVWDLVASDYSLPGFSGADALALLRERGLDTPFIFVSGSIGEEIAVAALKAGANDYVMKGDLTRLIPAIDRELREVNGRRARKDAETALLASERRLRTVFDTALDALIVIGADGRVTSWNARAEEVFGWPGCETIGRPLAEIIIPQGQRQAHLAGLARFRETGSGPLLRRRIEVTALHRDGHEFPIELAISPVRLGNTWEFSAFIRDLTTQRAAEAALHEAEASYATLVDRAPVGIFRSSLDGRFLSVNQALVRMLGYGTREEVLALDLATEVYADPTERQRVLAQRGGDLEYAELETRWKRKDGRVVNVQLSVRTVRGRDPRLVTFETVVRDVTKQRELEKQLGLAQRMEAIGRLAGGVAHDFNNLLTVILSHTELMLEELPAEHPHREDHGEVRKAATAAASLTRQLLAFSRQQVLQPVPLDLNEVIAGIEKMLRRLIGEDIALTTELAPELGPVKADPGQVEQVILNLAVNARDAMPEGGRLTIATGTAVMDDAFVRAHPPAIVGSYVTITVSDSGIGMDAETQIHIFEPFFTTKEVGKGTGLGLATVYGIVKQSGGFIWVTSELGHGATFTIYLPLANEPAQSIAIAAAGSTLPHGTETILLVEDVDAVRSVARHALQRHGYTVLEAPDGNLAVQLAHVHQGTIHLVLTDVVLPTVGGVRLVDAILAAHPQTRVLFMSGYPDRAIADTELTKPGIGYLQKPFTPEALVRRVRDLLDGVSRGA